MPRSLLEAIRQGDWSFEPSADAVGPPPNATDAMPGTEEKLVVLAQRLACGLPLWHPQDRQSYNDADRE